VSSHTTCSGFSSGNDRAAMLWRVKRISRC
jgi:hypothetical protein